MMTRDARECDSLTEAEGYLYERAVGTYNSLNYSADIQHKHELVEGEVWEAYPNVLDRRITAPRYATALERIKSAIQKAFGKPSPTISEP